MDTCVQQIKALLLRPEFAETDESRAQLQGMALSAHVRAALNADEATRSVDASIEGRHGDITRRGIVTHDADKNATLRVAEAVAGVKSIVNQLHAMSDALHFLTYRR